MTNTAKTHAGITYWTRDGRRFTNHKENLLDYHHSRPLAEVVQRASEIDCLDEPELTKEDDWDYSEFYLTGFRWVTAEEDEKITAAIAKERKDTRDRKKAKEEKERAEYERLRALFEKEEK